ncbi:MAG: hypothetical protein LBR80_05920 [Deltaproteobacteria bacterium]|jgi:hypothetical protein|nr:hypothetical protein [Deltaproteobacteria bacterium]
MNGKEHDIIMTLAPTTPGIIQSLMNERGFTAEFAAMVLFNSKLYMMMEDKNMGLDDQMYPFLYSLLEEELATGNIVFEEDK